MRTNKFHYSGQKLILLTTALRANGYPKWMFNIPKKKDKPTQE